MTIEDVPDENRRAIVFLLIALHFTHYLSAPGIFDF